jgi:ABC-type uncharacterized transport system substrate-binding protein
MTSWGRKRVNIGRRGSIAKEFSKTNVKMLDGSIELDVAPKTTAVQAFERLMNAIVQRMWLSVTLIVGASLSLLLQDLNSRVTPDEHARKHGDGGGGREPKADQPANRVYHIALAAFGPDRGSDAAAAGLLEGLRQIGYEEGKNLKVTRRHAQGEVNLVPAMLQSLDGGDVDCLVTFTTPVLTSALGTVRQKPVVFAHVIDPIAAGAGVSFENHHPNVTGIGSFPPIEATVDFMLAMRPKLKRVGSIYNSGEANSTRTVQALRDALAKNGVEWVDVNVATTGEVAQAVDALIAKKPELIYVPGDNTVHQALESVTSRVAQAKVPLILDDAGQAMTPGVLAGVGVGHFDAGRAASEPLARVLQGEKPSEIPIANVSPEYVVVNPKTAGDLGLEIPPAVLQMEAGTAPSDSAARAVEAEAAAPRNFEIGQASAGSGLSAGGPPTRFWKIALVQYVETVPSEDAQAGVKEALAETGWGEGRDYSLRTYSAQGDMSTLPQILDTVVADRFDMMITFSTPTLQAAASRVRAIPVVFNFVTDPFIAGAGKTSTDHLPNFTGTYLLGPFEELLGLLREYYPRIKRIGTTYNPAEINSVYNEERLRKVGAELGFEVVTVAANGPAELADAALALTQRNLDALVQVPDNLAAAGFPTIAAAARKGRLPLFTLLGDQAKLGAVLTMSRDYRQGGIEAGQKAVEVMRGTSPAKIPIELVQRIVLVVNVDAAREAGLTIPPGLLRQADAVIGKTQP